MRRKRERFAHKHQRTVLFLVLGVVSARSTSIHKRSADLEERVYFATQKHFLAMDQTTKFVIVLFFYY